MAELRDDETRLAKWRNLTADEKAAIRTEQQTAFKKAASERTRPLGSRILDTLQQNLPGNPARKKEVAQIAAEDQARRTKAYESAKVRAAMTDEDLDKESKLYGTSRTLKLADNQLKKGGKVKGYAKGGKIDGCAQRGKTRGKMV